MVKLAFFRELSGQEKNQRTKIKKKLEQNQDGSPRSVPSNYVHVLENDPRTKGVIRLNELDGRKYITADLGWKRKITDPLDDNDLNHIRLMLQQDYRYAYGAVETRTGDGFFLVLPYCDTTCMNVFLHEMAKTYPDDELLLVCDGARWHRSNGLKIPENIHFTFIPPYTPEMNPIEQIWKEIRKRGFRNEAFTSLDKVIERLCDTIKNLPATVISSITGRDWILNIY